MIRILENANGTKRIQFYDAEISGFDEDGVAHYSGRGNWVDAPVFRYGDWTLDGNGEVVVIDIAGASREG